MNSNDLEGDMSALAEPFVAGRECVLESDSDFFHRDEENRDCNSERHVVIVMSTISRKFFSCNRCGVGPVPKQLGWGGELARAFNAACILWRRRL
jgi:hypothetical protein